ncbi:nucleotide-sugar transporter family protein [Hibiscus syriacus]|uniref:Nucleotide-sugar transporter family protein n=1 Tax=Hibiscus syriacus TaxID=106335 RepID=A0A6A2YWR0_HIBSY|nr:nucleotide-sugar transporter family protein [Hibiscus syriacus]
MSETSSAKVLDMGNGKHQQASRNDKYCSFKMPLHYPRYNKSDYENMPECQLDCLLHQYGLSVNGDVKQKRKYAMGAFLWPS